MRGVVRENQPKLLTKLLQICFERFKNVVQAHGVVLSHLQRAKKVYKRSESTHTHTHTHTHLCCASLVKCNATHNVTAFELYKESDVWAAIQRVVRGRQLLNPVLIKLF